MFSSTREASSFAYLQNGNGLIEEDTDGKFGELPSKIMQVYASNLELAATHLLIHPASPKSQTPKLLRARCIRYWT